MDGVHLIGDIGGTNARFAMAADGGFAHLRVLHTGDYQSLVAAVRAYLSGVPDTLRPLRAALAIAGPVTGDHVALTNQNWSFSIAEATVELGLKDLLVVNDFAAAAMGIPYLAPADFMPIGGDGQAASGPIGVLGPGTGLGMSCLLPEPAGWRQLPSEGGHATMPATTEEESRIIAILRGRHEHVSAERVLTGAGLVNLYTVVCELAGLPARALEPADITEAALAGSDDQCGRALDLFCAMLGTVAGNLALTLCATGGVYIAGGIVPQFKERFAASEFRDRFVAKGRFRTYLEAIPTYLILHPSPALVGLANIGAFRAAAASARPI